MQDIKCVVVGDEGVGKTYLLVSYIENTNPEEHAYLPNFIDNRNVELTVDNKAIKLNLNELHGQEDYPGLRALSYHETDIFIVCFSIISPASYESVRTKWIPDLKDHCPNTPVLLVGTKLDLRKDPQIIASLSDDSLAPMTTQQGIELAKEIKAVKYYECSALTQEGPKIVFEEAIKAALQPPPTKKVAKKKCVIV